MTGKKIITGLQEAVEGKVARVTVVERKEAVTDIEQVREALEEMARQKLLEELSDDEIENADVEGGYDALVIKAREALAALDRMEASHAALLEIIGSLQERIDAADAMLAAPPPPANPDSEYQAKRGEELASAWGYPAEEKP